MMQSSRKDSVAPSERLNGWRSRTVQVDAIEGLTDALWVHYDVTNDVLYLRLCAYRDAPTVAEETPDGLLLLRTEEHGKPVGMTIVNWWGRFGSGALPDSIRQIGAAIEPWARRFAA